MENKEKHRLTASPIKLRSGDWGAKVEGKAVGGDPITVTTRAGKSWQAFVSNDRPKYRHDDDDEMFDPGACWDDVDEVDDWKETSNV